MSYLAGLRFPGNTRGPTITCDGCGFKLVVSLDSLPPNWFLDGKAAPKWRMVKATETTKRLDYCPTCKGLGK